MTDAIIISGFESTKSVFKKNYLLIILSAVFVFGILLGSWSICLSDSNSCFGIEDIFSNYYSFVSNGDFLYVFLYSLFAFSFLLLISYFTGLCALGNFLNIPMLFLVGFGCGITSGYLYFAKSLNGICFFSVIILPSLFLFCITLILSLKQSFLFSRNLFRLIRGQKTSGLLTEFKRYSFKFLLFFILIIICSVLNSALAVTFSRFFNF